MTRGQKIKAAREASGLTQEELGAACGTTKQTIFKYENEIVTNIPMDRIEQIASVLNISPAYLMGWDESSSSLPNNIVPMPQMRKIPLIGTIACGEPILAQENIDGEVDLPDHIHADFALHCKGDSMINARIFDGDIVYIRQQNDVDNGQIAAVLIGDEATLKRVYKYPGRLELRPENPTFPVLQYEGEQLAEIRIIGKAVAFTSTVR